jgi:DNA polymerase I-like protein with 3'-5' exonuclease and polymerase domains
MAWLLMQKLAERLQVESLFEAFRKLEMPLVPVLAEMEYLGLGTTIEL